MRILALLLSFAFLTFARSSADSDIPKTTLFYNTVSGIGAVFNSEHGKPTVHGLLDDGPAQKAGLKVGDVITRVGDQSVAGLKLSQVVDLVRGPEGSTAKITVLRDGHARSFSIVRELIRVRRPNSEESPQH